MLWQSFPSSVNVVSLVDALEWPWSNQTLVVVEGVVLVVVVAIVVVSNSFFSFLRVYLTASNSWQLHIYFCFLSLSLSLSVSFFPFLSSSSSSSPPSPSARRSLMPITTKHMIITTPAIINQPEKKRRAKAGEVSPRSLDYSSGKRHVWIRAVRVQRGSAR